VNSNLKSLVLKTGRLDKSRSRSLLKKPEDLTTVFAHNVLTTP